MANDSATLTIRIEETELAPAKKQGPPQPPSAAAAPQAATDQGGKDASSKSQSPPAGNSSAHVYQPPAATAQQPAAVPTGVQGPSIYEPVVVRAPDVHVNVEAPPAPPAPSVNVMVEQAAPKEPKGPAKVESERIVEKDRPTTTVQPGREVKPPTPAPVHVDVHAPTMDSQQQQRAGREAETSQPPTQAQPPAAPPQETPVQSPPQTVAPPAAPPATPAPKGTTEPPRAPAPPAPQVNVQPAKTELHITTPPPPAPTVIVQTPPAETRPPERLPQAGQPQTQGVTPEHVLAEFTDALTSLGNARRMAEHYAEQIKHSGEYFATVTDALQAHYRPPHKAAPPQAPPQVQQPAPAAPTTPAAQPAAPATTPAPTTTAGSTATAPPSPPQPPPPPAAPTAPMPSATPPWQQYLDQARQQMLADNARNWESQKQEWARRQVDPDFDRQKSVAESPRPPELPPGAGMEFADYLKMGRENMQREEALLKHQEEAERARRQVDTRYDIKQSIAEGAKPPPLPAGGGKTWQDYLAEARESMEREQEQARDKERADKARRRVDPVYREQREKEEKAARPPETSWFRPSPEAGNRAGQAAMGLAAGGMTTAAGIAGGFAAGGPVGAAVAAVNAIKEAVVNTLKTAFSFGTSIASFDGDKLARGFADLTAKVPIVGGLFGALTHGVLDLSDAVFATAKRLAQYSGPLAVQQAMIEVRQIQRDIQRAQQFGPEIMAAVDARFEFQQKIEDFMDRNMPKIMELTEAGLKILEQLFETTTQLPGAIVNPLLTVISSLFPGLGAVLVRMKVNLDQIVDNTSPPTSLDGVLDGLFGMGGFDMPNSGPQKTPNTEG